jgi:Cu+-exporting ATPase
MALVEPIGVDMFRPLAVGGFATLAMLGIYFGALTLVSGWDFTVSQFLQYWPYVVALTLGFGLQIGL